jgi:hypothetical protein
MTQLNPVFASCETEFYFKTQPPGSQTRQIDLTFCFSVVGHEVVGPVDLDYVIGGRLHVPSLSLSLNIGPVCKKS